jgi:periplasmic protein TonB
MTPTHPFAMRMLLLLSFLSIGSGVFAQDTLPIAPIDPLPPGEIIDIETPKIMVEPADVPQEPLAYAEQMPEFPGGQEAMMAYMVRNMHYPQECIENEVEGKVFMGFVVDLEGGITEVKVMRGVRDCPALDKEALRVVSSMPKWTPGRQNGQPVRVRMTVPVMFKLN